MMRLLVLGIGLAAAAPAIAAPATDPFIDDRSSAERVVTSLYNAIDRQEYLRGWSYFSESTAPAYEEFRDGYANTEAVELRIGEATSEGAAGSIHSSVPVALRATTTDGTTTVYQGCYRLTQVQPAIQDAPPYRPIQIDSGALTPTDQPFDTAMGQCE
ncbi:hypothetical protein MU516_02610 [Paracoccus sp. YLB-12]|uniref:DUF1176 domain-containing protein n=1 Tax=Paracoccus maritimus TaxID=2933292 RepID=A0ABT2K5D4_9RHOB|nr:hypothetical protein [Paracoccus sp. YLB-12]MCT4331758.1 hypothetical protein [Paracoccus sp. YLB-12]